MKDFAAIDFETATSDPASVCSVGVVIVRNGEVVDSYYSLVRPKSNRYNYWNTRVHGLSAQDTEDAPCFPEVWAQIVPLIEGLPLIAHNCSFDSRCLIAAHEHYGMPYPCYTFLCTCQQSRCEFPKPTVPCHTLDAMSDFFGINLTNHHNALDDAYAYAEIALRLKWEGTMTPLKIQNKR